MAAFGAKRKATFQIAGSGFVPKAAHLTMGGDGIGPRQVEARFSRALL